ncbi:MAG: hypothetical protein N2112_00095 [Gemmataceae bacterium]|nr:hypothetical protein [Gemmataceae bacterium]
MNDPLGDGTSDDWTRSSILPDDLEAGIGKLESAGIGNMVS